jgi:hypothetical protein
LTEKGRKVLPSKPCKAVIEAIQIDRPNFWNFIFGSEPMQFNGKRFRFKVFTEEPSAPFLSM